MNKMPGKGQTVYIVDASIIVRCKVVDMIEDIGSVTVQPIGCKYTSTLWLSSIFATTEDADMEARRAAKRLVDLVNRQERKL
jgi:hypothetical protein